MTTEFLVLANVWLFTRLVCLFRDESASGRAWRIKTGLELIVLAVLYPAGPAWTGLALTLTALNLLGFWLERRARRRDLSRLLIGLGGLAAFSVWLSPRLGLGFRPELAAWKAQLGSWTSLEPLLSVLSHHRLHVVLFGVLVSANESNLVIRAVFDWLDLKPRLKPARDGAVEVDVGEFNRGRIIGVLERVLLFGFVLQMQYGAIGFILAAKAFTRFKALDDRPFAEYVLIGTLLSACLALATGGAVRWLLTH